MSPIWNRRTFLANAAISAAASRSVFAAPDAASSSYLAFVGVASPDQPALDRIETYRVQDGRWFSVGISAPATRPQALALHPRLPVLYAAHSTATHNYLPRGSVSAFVFDPESGELSPLGQRPMALSATHPGSLSVSPDGQWLLVAATGGSAWNFFSLAADGSIRPTPSALKLTGCGPHPLQTSARPHSVVHHPATSYAYASDFGSDRIDQIALGCKGAMLSSPAFAKRIHLQPGSGPAHLSMHPSGNMLAMTYQLRPALQVFGIESNGDVANEPLQSIPLDAEAVGPLAQNRQGNRLYLATQQSPFSRTVSTYTWSSSTRKLSRLQQIDLPGTSFPAKIIVMDHQLLLLGHTGIDAIALLPGDGNRTNEVRSVMKMPMAVSLAIHPLNI